MKRIFTLMLALSMMLAFCACSTGSSETTPVTTEGVKQINLTAQELMDALKTQLGESYGCSVAEEEAKISGYYHLDMTRIDSWAAECNAVSSVNMDQAVILKVKDGYAQEAAAGLQKGFDQKAGYAQLYNMDLFRINEARLFVQGNYVALLILGNPGDREASAEVQAEFAAEEGKKTDAAWASVFGEAPQNIIVIPEPGESGTGGGMRPGVRPRG